MLCMIKTAIIGAGGISIAHITALNKLDNVKVVAVMDINPENAKQKAELCGAQVYDKMEDFLDKVDMIHLLTPPSKRVEYAIKAMKAGKHILCEKPISSTVSDAEQMVDAAEKYGVHFMMAFNHRFRDGYRMLQEAVKSGELGDVINFWSHRLGTGVGFGKYKLSHSWRTDPNLVCGMSIESLSHDVDMMVGAVGNVTDVRANTLGTIKELPKFDNNSNAVFRLACGGTGLIHASWSSHISSSARGVIGTKGTAVVEGDDLWDFMQFRIKTEDMPYTKIIQLNDRFDNSSYYNENKYFLECIEKNQKPIPSGEDGLQVLKVCLAIVESNSKDIIVDI